MAACQRCYIGANENGDPNMECINCGTTVCDPCSEECCEEDE
jgi:hypothetical protein